MSMELTPRFLDRLRLIELVTAVCILASLTFLLIAYRGEGKSSSRPATTASIAITAEGVAANAQVMTSTGAAQRPLKIHAPTDSGT